MGCIAGRWNLFAETRSVCGGFRCGSRAGRCVLPRISVIFAAGGSCGIRHLDDPPIRHVST